MYSTKNSTVNIRLDNVLDKDYALAYDSGDPSGVLDLLTRHLVEVFLQICAIISKIKLY